MKYKIYFENLDGLRFFSFLAVFFFHSFHSDFEHIKTNNTYTFLTDFLFANGNLGVNFFFVLSGFLITYLLLAEKEKYGKISVTKFYVRRILRIWPLYFAAVIYGFLVFPQLKMLFGQVPNETANPISYLLFFANFDLLWNGLPDASVLGVLWSISVEEQFYILWPLVFYIVPSRYYKYIFPVLIIGSLVFRFMFNTYMMHEYHSLSCMSDMAIGGLGAWLIYSSQKFKNIIENLNKKHIAFIWLGLVFAFLFRDLLMLNEYLRVIERLLIGSIFLLIILEQNFSKNSLFKIGRIKYIDYLGKISYGLYCLHFIGILIAINFTNLLHINDNLYVVLILETIIALTITILIAIISYQIYEKPFLKLKSKFQRVKSGS